MDIVQLMIGITSVVCGSCGGAYIGVKVQLKYMQRDIDRAHFRLDKIDELGV